jgi:hypothetical protein
MLPKFVKVFPHEYKRILGVVGRASARAGLQSGLITQEVTR